MATRVFEIAKELGVKSKAIVDKCHAEGIPAEVIKNHMSTVSVGLEQTIREWFASGEPSGTAVEQTDRVDLDAVREEKPRSKARRAGATDDAPDSDADTSVAVVEEHPPAPTTATAPAKAGPIRAASITGPAQAMTPGTAATPLAAAKAIAAPAAPAPAAGARDDAPAVRTPQSRMPAGLNSRPPAQDTPPAPTQYSEPPRRPGRDDSGQPRTPAASSRHPAPARCTHQ